jgi:hypothetical protein
MGSHFMQACVATPVQPLVQVSRNRGGEFPGSIVSMCSSVWQGGGISQPVGERPGMALSSTHYVERGANFPAHRFPTTLLA